MAWFIASILAILQRGTCVNVFTHLQQTSEVTSAQIKHLNPAFQPRRPLRLTYHNIESQSTLKDRFQKNYVETFKSPNISNDRWKTIVRGQMSDDQHSSSEIDPQFIVYEYLESIDRRYKRVHQSETNDNRSQRGFTSAWA